MRTAHREVHDRAAAYLGVAPVIALVLAGVVELKDFIWPEAESMDIRLHKELAAMRKDPLVAPFVPSSLEGAPTDLKIFVLWLYREVRGAPSRRHRGAEWLAALHESTLKTEQGYRAAGRGFPDRPDGLF